MTNDEILFRVETPFACFGFLVREGTVTVVTDHIDRFVPEGIVLRSGRLLEADVVITATGLRLLAFGGLEPTVDGEKVKPLSGPSRTVVAIMPVLVPLPLPELPPPFSLAVADFPQAAPTNASTTNPSRSPRRVPSRCIS